MDNNEITINVAPIEERDDHQIVTLVDAGDILTNDSIVQFQLNCKEKVFFKTLSPHCLICNAKLSVSGRGAMQLFSKKMKTSTRNMDIDCALGNIVNRKLNMADLHSTIICKKCFRLIDDIDTIEGQIQSMREELYAKFIQTEAFVKNEYVGNSKQIDIEEKSIDQCGDRLFKIYSARQKYKKSKRGKFKKSLGPPSFLKLEVKEEDSNDFLTCFNLEESSATFEDSISTADVDEEEDCNGDDFSNSEMIIDDVENIIEIDGLDMCSIDNTIQIGSIVLPTVNGDKDSSVFIGKARDIYVCRYCQQRMATFSNMHSHILDLHSDRLFECELCQERLDGRDQLLQHLHKHVLTGEKPSQCHFCSKRFPLPRQLREHVKHHYNKIVSCYKCPKKFRTENALQQHMNSHTGSRPFQCDICFKCFATKSIIRTHMKIHGIRSRPHKCIHCSKTFLTQHHLNDHLQIHQNNKEYICEACGKKYCSPRSLELHAITHSGVKNFMCKICNKAFARKGEMDDHERTHTGEKPFQCEICGSQFSQRSNLQTHKRSTHYEDKRYECNQCSKAFKRRRLLMYHVMSVHTGERPFKCDYCAAAFVYPEHYKKHMRIHTGEKPFKCEICSKAFNSRDNKNAHKFIHSDKKQYECLLCGMGFMRKPQLVAHIRQHGRDENIEDFIKVNPATIVDEELNCSLFASNPLDQNIEEMQLVRSNETNHENVQILNRADPIIVESDNSGIPSYILPLRSDDLELIAASQINQIAEVAAAQVASTPMDTSEGGQNDSTDYRFIQLHFEDEDKLSTSDDTKSKTAAIESRHIQLVPSSAYKKLTSVQQGNKIRSWHQ